MAFGIARYQARLRSELFHIPLVGDIFGLALDPNGPNTPWAPHEFTQRGIIYRFGFVH